MTHQEIDPRQQWKGRAVSVWKQKIEDAMDPAQGGKDRRAAVVKVDIDNPGLREQMLEEWKPEPKARFSNQTVRSFG